MYPIIHAFAQPHTLRTMAACYRNRVGERLGCMEYTLEDGRSHARRRIQPAEGEPLRAPGRWRTNPRAKTTEFAREVQIATVCFGSWRSPIGRMDFANGLLAREGEIADSRMDVANGPAPAARRGSEIADTIDFANARQKKDRARQEEGKLARARSPTWTDAIPGCKVGKRLAYMQRLNLYLQSLPNWKPQLQNH